MSLTLAYETTHFVWICWLIFKTQNQRQISFLFPVFTNVAVSALSLSSLDSIFYLQPQPVMTKVNIMYLLPGLTHNVFYCNIWKLWICFFTFNCNQANHNTLCTWMYLYSLIVWCWKHWCFCWSLAGTRRCVSKLLLWVFTNYIRRITNDWL